MTDEETPPWIETLAKLSGYVGMNRTQVRWRLIRWNERRKTPKAERAPIIRRADEQPGLSVSTILALVIMTTYARVWVAQGGGFAAPPPLLLFDFGGQWQATAPDEPWRLLTAIFLHAGIWHLLFNLFALAQIGPELETIWGRTSMLFIFVVTGIAGNIASASVHPNVIGIGASGGICGLIGAAIGYGQRLGNSRGIAIRNSMLRWLAYTIVFGFVVNADNIAHGGGAIAGGAFGYFVAPAVWRKRGLKPVRVIAGVIGIAATIAAVAIILTRQKHGDLYTIDFPALICGITGNC